MLSDLTRGRRATRLRASGFRLRALPKPEAAKDFNLTIRMSIRRFTCLTNVFSQKIENHAAMVALYFMYYNFGRVHQTLRVTPAMEAGISDHVWSIEEIVALLG